MPLYIFTVNFLSAEHWSRQRVINELMVLLGADQLNLHQFRIELESMSLDDLAKMMADALDDLDTKFCPT
jgi:hypothetical protein